MTALFVVLAVMLTMSAVRRLHLRDRGGRERRAVAIRVRALAFDPAAGARNQLR